MEIEDEVSLALDTIDVSSRYEMSEWIKDWGRELINECRYLRSALYVDEYEK